MINTYKVVMYMKRSHRFCTIPTPDDGPRSGKKLLGTIHRSFFNNFPSDTIKPMRQLEWTYTKRCRKKISILFNEICFNEETLPKYTDTHRHIYIYIYICVCVCVCVCREREREGERENQKEREC